MTIINQVLFVDFDAVEKARDLCVGRGETEYVRAMADLIIALSPDLRPADADVTVDFLGAPDIDPNGPLTAEQRAALFAGFTDVFGSSDREQRLAFSRLVLNKTSADPVSWATWRPGTLTFAEASKVLDALNLLNV